MFPNRSYPYLYYTVTPLFFLVHMQSRHTVSDVYKDPCVAVESSVRLQPTCSYHLSLRIGEPDCCAFTCCATSQPDQPYPPSHRNQTPSPSKPSHWTSLSNSPNQKGLTRF